jgi:hypothetical protein
LKDRVSGRVALRGTEGRNMLGTNIRSQLLAAVAIVALAACSSTPQAMTGATPKMGAMGNPVADGLHPNKDAFFFHIKYDNQIDAYTVLTVYWSYQWDPAWHISTAHCVAPGAVQNTVIGYAQPGQEAKVRIEVRSQKDCQGPNLPGGDIMGPKCWISWTYDKINEFTSVEGYGSKNNYGLTGFRQVLGHGKPPCL